MELYATLKLLVLPPGGFILLAMAGRYLVRGFAGRVVTFLSFTVLLLLSLPAVSILLMKGLEVEPALTPEVLQTTAAEAILVLAAGTVSRAPEYGGVDTLDNFSLVRVRYGAWLHRATGLPIYVTGGTSENGEHPRPAVSQIMAQVLRDEFGVEVAGIEVGSRTTWENATRSAPMLRDDDIDHVLLVTHAWHMPRALDVMAYTDIEAIPAPTAFRSAGPRTFMDINDWIPQGHSFATSWLALHEYFGRAYYHVKDALFGH